MTRGAAWASGGGSLYQGASGGPSGPRQASPAIWGGDRLHNEATAWLENRQATLRNDRSVSTSADRLVGWVRFLRSRGQTVHTAGEVDYRAYEACCRFPDGGDDSELTPVSAAWWRTTKSIISSFTSGWPRLTARRCRSGSSTSAALTDSPHAGSLTR